MRTSRRWIGLGTFFAMLLLMLILASEGQTVPYFSRKYRTSCVTCHEAFPRRNSVGEGFRMRGFRFVEVPEVEYKTMAPNVLALAPGKCLMLEGNPVTKKKLEDAGCEVFTYKGDEISLKAEGGATCLTRPILRG